MPTSCNTIKLEDGEIPQGNPFVKSEHDDRKRIVVRIPTVVHSTSRFTCAKLTICQKQESKVSKTKRKRAKGFRRWRGSLTTTKANGIQHTPSPPVQQGPQKKKKIEPRHNEKTLFSYNDDNLMLTEAFSPETMGLSDDDHETNGDQPYAITKEDFDNFFVGYSL